VSFEVRTFSDTGFFLSLAEANRQEFLTQSDVASHPHAKYLAEYLNEIGAKAIVVENDYIDGDYLEDYAAYYVRSFRPYRRFCRRLHFFGVNVTSETLRTAILEHKSDAAKQLQRHYLGFIVVRPLPWTIIGRTQLGTYPTARGRRHYTAVKPYAVSLFGLPLEIVSLAYQQQDGAVAACATVALWSCFHKTSQLFTTPLPRPAAITAAGRFAQSAGRSMPSKGLNVGEMCAAIRAIGLEPEVYRINVQTPILSLIYAYLALELPVILGVKIDGLDKHAITVNGYSLLRHAAPNGEDQVPQNVPLLGRRINELYAHDDGIGPFARITAAGPGTHPDTRAALPLVFTGSWLRQNGSARTLFPEVIVVPAYPKIRLTFIDMHGWLDLLTEALRQITTKVLDWEWDLHLKTINSFKQLLRERYAAVDGVPDLLLRPQPRFIWRAILRLNNRELLELIADATDVDQAFPIIEILWHDGSFKAAVQGVMQHPSLRATFDASLTRQFVELLLR
jgi:hypothetical protein